MPEQSDVIPAQMSASNALVVISCAETATSRSTFMSEAGFLAQLIACKAGIASYRRHRREEPAVATARYRDGDARISDSYASRNCTVRFA